eukprot:SAG31_NODE_21815_length_540_cov_0.875283_1_plen_43_part_10
MVSFSSSQRWLLLENDTMMRGLNPHSKMISLRPRDSTASKVHE